MNENGMRGKVSTTFHTAQDDMFESGLVRQIGANGYAIWSAIKTHVDYNTGQAHPSIRRLMEMTGLASATVQKAIATLMEAKLLRLDGTKGRSNRYVARERLDVRVGDRVLCTVVLDYVPSRLRGQLKRLADSLDGKPDAEGDIWSEVEIIPGAGFVWNPATGSLQGRVAAREFPSSGSDKPEVDTQLAKRIAEISNKARVKK